ALVGGAAEEGGSFGVVLRHVLTVVVALREGVLRFRVALVGHSAERDHVHHTWQQRGAEAAGPPKVGFARRRPTDAGVRDFATLSTLLLELRAGSRSMDAQLGRVERRVKFASAPGRRDPSARAVAPKPAQPTTARSRH
ncbi:hypothetical protein T492DRAFT_859161, partial [Pavlovales sp. CCMP2436]